MDGHIMIGFGRYNLLLKLGQGGMGAVYLARQRNLKRFCAIKVISPQYSSDEDSAKRFLNEAQAAAALSHPNIVSIFDCDEFNKQYFLAMEFVEGMSLGEIIRTLGPLPLPLALHWLNQAAIGLDYLHGKGIVHRDIKPDNMMIDSEGTMKIMDLGLAKHHFEGNLSMTSTGTIMGSPHYMSPEQIQDSKTADHRSDLYSLGIVVYQILTGKVPYNKSSASAVYMAHLTEPIPPVSSLRPGMDQPVDTLIGKLTAKDRKLRMQSAAELIEELKPWVANNPFDDETRAYWEQFESKKHLVQQLLAREKIDPATMDREVPAGKAGGAPGTPSSSILPKLLGIVALPIIVLLLVLGGGAWFLLRSGGNAGAGSASPPSPGSTPHATTTPTIPTATPKPKEGGLSVKTQPEQAIVIFRSNARPSPVDFPDIPVGKYPVRITLKGYQEVRREIEITDGNFTELNVTLARDPGTITLASQPSGASVIVKDKVVGVTPYKLPGTDGEIVEGKLRLDGYEDRSFKVTLTAGGSEHSERLLASARSAGTAPGGTAKPVNAPGRDLFLRDTNVLFTLAVMYESQRSGIVGRISYASESFSQMIDRMLTQQQRDKLATLREQAVANLAQGTDAAAAADQALADVLKIPADQRKSIADTADQIRVSLKKRAEERVRGFKVTGVSTMGDAPTATLNNLVIQQGKTYNNRRGGTEFQYTVVKVDQDNVILSVDDIEVAIPVSGSSIEKFIEE